MKDQKTIGTLDYHTAGEPLRIITSGLPPIPGDTMLGKRAYMRKHHDDIRRLLMLEPRGHADMYGAVITEPVERGSDCGVLFLHNQGYSTMCGHGIIALVTAAVEHGLFDIENTGEVKIDTPAGLIEACVERNGNKVESVSFLNVPSFVLQEFKAVPLRGLELNVTIAYGGAFYAYVDAEDAGLELKPENAAKLVSLGRELTATIAALTDISHPGGAEDLGFLYGVIFIQHGNQTGYSRNVCIFADGELDRSPTGTGVSGRAAIHFARGEISLGQTLTIDSILGTVFTVECVSETRAGNLKAVITRVRGNAYMTGEHKFVLDSQDPLKSGFFIR